MPPEVPRNLAGVDDEHIEAVVGVLPALPNIVAEPADRFAQAVRSLVEKRAQEDWPNELEEDIAVFVMVNHPRPVGEAHGAQPFADPIAKDEPLLGRLYFANRDASSGQAMRIPVANSNAIIQWLEDQRLGDCPIVTVYRRSKTMITRRGGTGDLAKSDPIRDQKPAATLHELEKALKHFHLVLLTPTSCPNGVWKSGYANRYIPGSQPEKSIQYHLGFALSFWFHGVLKAEHEDHINIGRIDVRLLKKSEQGSLAYWATMELKIIKSFTNPRTVSASSPVGVAANVKTIVEGIRQAWAYRNNRHAEEGLLEVYDLRKDKGQNLMRHVSVMDAMTQCEPAPVVHMWPIFGSSADARNAGYTGV